MFDEVQTFCKIKDKSINDVIKATKFLVLCGRELTSTNLGNPFEWPLSGKTTTTSNILSNTFSVSCWAISLCCFLCLKEDLISMFVKNGNHTRTSAGFLTLPVVRAL